LKLVLHVQPVHNVFLDFVRKTPPILQLINIASFRMGGDAKITLNAFQIVVFMDRRDLKPTQNANPTTLAKLAITPMCAILLNHNIARTDFVNILWELIIHVPVTMIANLDSVLLRRV